VLELHEAVAGLRRSCRDNGMRAAAGSVRGGGGNTATARRQEKRREERGDEREGGGLTCGARRHVAAMSTKSPSKTV
jgi:hypothetical protein